MNVIVSMLANMYYYIACELAQCTVNTISISTLNITL